MMRKWSWVLALLVLAQGCTVSVEPARVICRGDSVNVDHVDSALVRCSTLDSLVTR